MSVAAAFVLLGSVLTVLYFMKYRTEPVGISRTADSHILVDGSALVSTVLMPGQKLSIRQGTVSISLNPSTRAIITAPAGIRLRDKLGNVDLVSGAAYFEVRAKGPHKGIAVHAAGRIVRDIGTHFGVVAENPHGGEAHVFSGSISISGDDAKMATILQSGHAASWSDKPGVTEIGVNAGKFLTSLPQTSTLLADDFSDPDGTPIDGKAADQGSKWEVLSGFEQVAANTVATGGRYDSSYGPREFAQTSFMILPLQGNPTFT